MLPEPVKPLEEWHLNHGAHEFELGNSSLFQLTCRNASSGYAMYLGDARDVKEFRTKAEAEASVDVATTKAETSEMFQDAEEVVLASVIQHIDTKGVVRERSRFIGTVNVDGELA